MEFQTLTTRKSIDFIERKPAKNTVHFQGIPINLSGLALITRIHVSVLSRIFRCQRMPTISQARVISNVFGMNMDDLILGLEDEKKTRDIAAELEDSPEILAN